MAKPRCPKCGAIARHLERPSKLARVDVFACDKCSYLWSVTKTDPETEPKKES